MNSIKSRIFRIIADIKTIDVDEIQLSEVDDFLTKYDLDSMSTVMLCLEICQAFGVQFGREMQDIESLQSFGTLCLRVQQLQESVSAA
jgi:acyl carrier protein